MGGLSPGRLCGFMWSMYILTNEQRRPAALVGRNSNFGRLRTFALEVLVKPRVLLLMTDNISNLMLDDIR